MAGTMNRRTFITTAAGATIGVASAIGIAAAVEPSEDVKVAEVLRLFEGPPSFDRQIFVVWASLYLGYEVPTIVRDPKAILAGRVRAARSLLEKGDRAGASRCLEGTGIEL